MEKQVKHAVGNYRISAKIEPILLFGYAVTEWSIYWVPTDQPVTAAGINNYFRSTRFDTIEEAEEAVLNQVIDLDKGIARGHSF